MNKCMSKSQQRKIKRIIRLTSGLKFDSDDGSKCTAPSSADIAEFCIGSLKATADTSRQDACLKFSVGNGRELFAPEMFPNFIRITHRIMTAILGQYVSSPDKTVHMMPISEAAIIQQATENLGGVSSKDVACVLLHLVQKSIIRPVSEHSPRQFVFCCAAHSAGCDHLAAAAANAVSAVASAKSKSACDISASVAPDSGEASHVENVLFDARLRWDGRRGGLLQHAILFVPIGSSVDTQENGECAGCVEFADKYAAQVFLGEWIQNLHATLQIPFFTAAKELIACHGDPCSVILKVLDCSLHLSMFGPCSSPASRINASPQSGDVQAHQPPVNEACAVCFAESDDDCIIMHLPCGDRMCEDCFAAHFLNDEFGALPECETPHAMPVCASESLDFFCCPLCRTELSPAFWDTFPQNFSRAKRSGYCRPDLTLSDIHSRIVASVLRQLRRDRFASIARCNCCSEASRSSCSRYAFAFGGSNRQVTCFGRLHDSIVDAQTASSNSSGTIMGGLYEAQAEMWMKIQLDVKTYDNRSKRLNRAGNRMTLHNSRYYCKMPYTTAATSKGSEEKECSPSQGQCPDCMFTAADLADEIKPVFVPDSERGNRETDFRMCPKCFGGYFINMWCSDLQAHQGQQKEFQVRNVCPDCGFFSSNWADYPKACERLKAQTLRSRVPFLKMVTTSVGRIEQALDRTLAAIGAKQQLLTAILDQPIAIFVDSAISRVLVRRLLLKARRIMITVALDSVDPTAVPCPESKQARLMLQLMDLSQGYSVQFCHPLELVKHPSRTSDAYTISAVLMAFSASRCWLPETLDKIVSGDIGERSVAQSFIKRAMDQALLSIHLLFPSYLQSKFKRRLLNLLPHIAATAVHSPSCSDSHDVTSDGSDA